MEPAARTVASGPEWPMRDGGPGNGPGQPLGTQGTAAAVQVSDRPQQRGGSCACVPQAAQEGGSDAAGLWNAARYKHRGGGNGEG